LCLFWLSEISKRENVAGAIGAGEMIYRLERLFGRSLLISETQQQQQQRKMFYF
jgi:hypothetical protein